jgi:cyclic lactone autoinducer peptide
MKKFMKYAGIATACSFVLAVAAFMTTTCVGLVHEPEMPEELKK